MDECYNAFQCDDLVRLGLSYRATEKHTYLTRVLEGSEGFTGVYRVLGGFRRALAEQDSAEDHDRVCNGYSRVIKDGCGIRPELQVFDQGLERFLRVETDF